MDIIQRHFILFSPRIKKALEKYSHWESVCEIRLRPNAPLSLTDHRGNITIDENGIPCPLSQGIITYKEDLSHLVASFCGGSVYRYFENLQDGFAVDEDGWRLGLCTQKLSGRFFLPDRILGINLRIPRHVPFAAKPILQKMRDESFFSLLICSPPGEGKTTTLRSLGAMLSLGNDLFPPQRVTVIDERGELFPTNMKIRTGLLDVLPYYEKSKGIELATRLFSPQIILCDEIGSIKEADSILSACSGGCSVVATAHAGSVEEAKRSPLLAKLMESGKFQYVLFLNKEADETFRCRFSWYKLL